MKDLKEKVLAIVQEAYPELRKKSKRELYFEQFNKIADLKLRELCKERYDDNYSVITPTRITLAIDHMCHWRSTKEGYRFWKDTYKRQDLETNPYIISDCEVEEGNDYFAPAILSESDFNIVKVLSYTQAKNLKEKGLLFRTKEEAIEMSKAIIDFVKSKK